MKFQQVSTLLTLLLTNVVLVDGFVVTPRSSLPLSSTTNTNRIQRAASTETNDTTDTINDKNDDELPDYGKTSIEIEKHSLSKKENKWRRRDLYGQSLITQTMSELATDVEYQETAERLKSIGVDGMSREERARRRRALDSLGIPSFGTFLSTKVDDDSSAYKVTRREPEVLQLNVGLYCNQACGHCHVESSPLRKETMSKEVAARCLEILRDTPSVHTLDLTGGAPELNESFRYLVRMAREIRPDLDIIDRCNLTVLQEPGQEDLLPFLVENRVHVIASLPCYSAENVDQQRGGGVFERSISALLALNEVGYGHPDTGLQLDLVYNPLGAFLPPSQGDLEVKYKEVLMEEFEIVFGSLFTMTNMPVKRFADFLHKRDELKNYMDLLVRNFNRDTLRSLMCSNTVSVGYDGKIYDCDFNQQLGYTIGDKDKPKTLFDIDSLTDLKDVSIRTDNHCFGCTAGMGSS